VRYMKTNKYSQSKLIGVIKIALKNEIAYRLDFVIWACLLPLFVIVYYFLWKSIFSYSSQTVIRGFTFEALISYYVISMVVSMFAHTSIDRQIAKRVRSGNLLVDLIKPITFIRIKFYQFLGHKLMNLFVYVIPLLAIGYILINITVTYLNLILFIISVALAMILMFLFAFTFGMVSFWTTKYEGLSTIRQGISWFLSGGLVPLTFFPAYFQKISYFLPFQYFRYIPTQIFLGHFPLKVTFLMIGAQIVWIAILFAVVKISWRKAIAKFTGVGT